MEHKLFRQLKVLVRDLSSDRTITRPRGWVSKQNLDDETMRFLQRFVNLLLNTDFIGEGTKIYLCNEYISYEGVWEILKDRGATVTKKTVQSKVWYDKTKIQKYFGDNCLTELVYLHDKKNLAWYTSQLESAYDEYGKSKILGTLSINLPDISDASKLKRAISAEEFESFVESIKPYTVRSMRTVEATLDASLVAYCKHLLNSTSLTPEGESRRELLLSIF